ncbi:MHC_I C-terminus family protein [Ectocarpus siliculosus]|uniref:MHC_I C-terminus family protein n=1 Tax=Ectocarpus siliculosus TaxID=2880 RepID=D8LTL5_ECTSI|nr:MHC_I C-terminus family protein [Ectocarpus siliculosus]|eukprot:CBN73912.1 MHC_I C-terminus family protein [Ectocarpus siliculosus]
MGKQSGGNAMDEHCWVRLHTARARRWYGLCSPRGRRVIDVNALFGGESESALHVAAARGAEKASTALMIAGADPNLRDRMNRSPLHLAAEAGHRHIIGILLKGADVDAWNDRQETPLHLAASKGHAPCISELLVGGADKDAIDSVGQTPLWHAADNNQLEATEELLAAGANYPGADVDAEATGSDCSTPLHVAVDRRVASIGTIGALLEGGADIHVFDEIDDTPLHRACKRSSVTGVELLLRRGADEELTNEEGDAPADIVGASPSNATVDEEIEVDNQRIRRMLARAPADRSWRRRGLLVLSRSCPTRVQIANRSSSGSSIGSSKGCFAKVSPASRKNSGGDNEETGDQMVMVDWRYLVCRLIELEVDGLFRLVVGFV